MPSAPASSPTNATPQNREPSGVWGDEDLRRDPHRDQEKSEKVRRMFASIAHRYDLNNRLHSFGRDQAWRRACVRESGLRPADAVLDVACGTGDLAMAFARAGAKSVIGIDYTPEMLAIARKRGAESPVTRLIGWIEGDAQNLPVEDLSVDIVSIAFGIRNVVDPARALDEFRRVLRPGGRLVVLEFGRPASPALAWLNDVYCQRIMPRTATLISGDKSSAYKYLPRSIETFLDRRAMVSAIERAGFCDVTQRPLTFGVCVCYRGLAGD